jgi:hypothetical protein
MLPALKEFLHQDDSARVSSSIIFYSSLVPGMLYMLLLLRESIDHRSQLYDLQGI